MLPCPPVLAGHSSNSRIVWEHTRGRYSCTQCPFSTASREDMTLHIEDHRKNPPAGRLEADMGTGGTPGPGDAHRDGLRRDEAHPAPSVLAQPGRVPVPSSPVYSGALEGFVCPSSAPSPLQCPWGVCVLPVPPVPCSAPGLCVPFQCPLCAPPTPAVPRRGSCACPFCTPSPCNVLGGSMCPPVPSLCPQPLRCPRGSVCPPP